MSKTDKNYKKVMLEFIEYFDKQALFIPSGPEGLTPAIYCLKHNYTRIFHHFDLSDGIQKCKFAAQCFFESNRSL